MDRNNIRERMDILGGLNSIEKSLYKKEEGLIKFIKKLNPLFKLYFDSDLNSETERNTMVGLCDAIYSTFKPSLDAQSHQKELINAFGITLAHKVSSTLETIKLIDMYIHGRITQEVYYHELSKRLVVKTVTFINNNWRLLENATSKGVQAVLLYFGVDSEAVEYINMTLKVLSEYGRQKINKLKDNPKVTSFVDNSLRKVGKALKVMSDTVEFAKEKGKEIYEKTKSFIENFADKVEVEYQRFRSSIKTGWNRLTSRFSPSVSVSNEQKMKQ